MGFLSDAGGILRMDYYTKPSVMGYTHVHPQYEIYFCPKSVAQISVINGMEYAYESGAVILSAPYTVHSMSCVDKDTKIYERYVFHFGEGKLNFFDSGMFPEDTFVKNAGLFFRLEEQEGAELREIAELYRKCRSDTERELTFALFINRLVAICPEDRISRIGTPSLYIRDVLRYISENFGNKVNITDIAKYFSVSRSKLDRDFKQFTGMSVHDYLDICRVNQAKFILGRKAHVNVGEIAGSCGFESESCFFHFFKKMTGLTPTEYRRKINAKAENKK